jgi:hypothetical protein
MEWLAIEGGRKYQKDPEASWRSHIDLARKGELEKPWSISSAAIKHKFPWNAFVV